MATVRILLRDARLAAGLTQVDLAARVAKATGRGIEGTRAMIARYEREGGPEPRPAIVADVLDALGLDLALVPRTSARGRKRGT